MTTAAELLKKIEDVSADDREKLDEIDARVCCFLNSTFKQVFVRMCKRGPFTGFEYDYDSTKFPEGSIGRNSQNLTIRYTRSRDALKAIRPDGSRAQIIPIGNSGKYTGHIFRDDFPMFSCPQLRTEELAELHSIIQAIDYDRNLSVPTIDIDGIHKTR